MISIKRAYDPPSEEDGYRILVDRLWPRGISKEKAKIDQWAKDVAPSTKLRQWFHHEEGDWDEFEKRYRAELKEHKRELQELAELAQRRHVTLVYGAKDELHNQAIVLKDELKKMTE